jgi:hypothetical protein
MLITTGASISGRIIAAKVSCDANPKTATATVMTNLKLLLAEVNESEVFLYPMLE